MEIICRITDQTPLSSTPYSDPQGVQRVYNSIGFTLASGSDMLYAELTGDAALRQAQAPALNRGVYYKADLTLKLDSYQGKDGQQHHGTKMYINRITVL